MNGHAVGWDLPDNPNGLPFDYGCQSPSSYQIYCATCMICVSDTTSCILNYHDIPSLDNDLLHNYPDFSNPDSEDIFTSGSIDDSLRTQDSRELNSTVDFEDDVPMTEPPMPPGDNMLTQATLQTFEYAMQPSFHAGEGLPLNEVAPIDPNQHLWIPDAPQSFVMGDRNEKLLNLWTGICRLEQRFPDDGEIAAIAVLARHTPDTVRSWFETALYDYVPRLQPPATAPIPPPVLEEDDILADLRNFVKEKFDKPCSSTRSRTSSAKLPLRCTGGCDYRTKDRYDWQRHEQNWQPQKFWHCCLCRGGKKPFICTRRDKLIDHFQQAHRDVREEQYADHADNSKVEVMTRFENKCKFFNGTRECGREFNMWEERIKHYLEHFLENPPDELWTLDTSRYKWFDDDEDEDNDHFFQIGQSGSPTQTSKFDKGKSADRSNGSLSHGNIQGSEKYHTRSQIKSHIADCVKGNCDVYWVSGMADSGKSTLMKYLSNHPNMKFWKNELRMYFWYESCRTVMLDTIRTLKTEKVERIVRRMASMPATDDQTATTLPRMLIDVHSKQLVSAGNNPRYLALDFESTLGIQSRESTISVTRTESPLDQETYLEQLSSTLDDAIETTREMGFRYLWISDLCEDHKDTGLLSAILKQAAFTIVPVGRDTSFYACPYDTLSEIRSWLDQDTSFYFLQGLGYGAYGKVDHVRVPQFQQSFARKVLVRSKTSLARKAMQFREVKIMRKLQHPSIVRLIAAFIQQESISILMTPVADCNLKTFLAEPLGWPEKRRNLIEWFEPLTSAVAYMHDESCAHFDLKPSNILIKGSHIFLSDFGVSFDSSVSKQDPIWTARGTPAYSAPEVAARMASGTKADIWSLGCVFAEMATVMVGKFVHDMREELQMRQYRNCRRSSYYQHVEDLHKWLRDISNRAETRYERSIFRICEKMLHLNPSVRPSARDLQFALVEQVSALQTPLDNAFGPINLLARLGKGYSTVAKRNDQSSGSSAIDMMHRTVRDFLSRDDVSAKLVNATTALKGPDLPSSSWVPLWRVSIVLVGIGGVGKTIMTSLEQGANLDVRDRFGHSSLKQASERGDGANEIAKLLLREWGMDITAQTASSCSLYKRSALHIAASEGKLKIVQALLDHSGARYRTPLHVAAAFNNVKLVEALPKGANINSRDEFACSPLILACRYGATEAVKILLQAGTRAEINAQSISCCRIDQHSALHVAVSKGHLETAKTLLDQRNYDLEHTTNMEKPLSKRSVQKQEHADGGGLPHLVRDGFDEAAELLRGLKNRQIFDENLPTFSLTKPVEREYEGYILEKAEPRHGEQHDWAQIGRRAVISDNKISSLIETHREPPRPESFLPGGRIQPWALVTLLLSRSIGSGIFLSPWRVLTGTGCVGGALMIWTLAGLISICGLHVWLECGLSMPVRRIQLDNRETKSQGVPRSGGEKNYLEWMFPNARDNPRLPHLRTTCSFAIVFILMYNLSANAVAFALQVVIATGNPVDNSHSHRGPVIAIAIGIQTLVILLHAISRRGGIWINNGFAFFKILLMLVIIGLGIVSAFGAGALADSGDVARMNFSEDVWRTDRSEVGPWTNLLLLCVFLFSGWEQPFYVLAETRSPRKCFPNYTIAAFVLVAVLYLLVNVSYLLVVDKYDILPASIGALPQHLDMTTLFFENLFGNHDRAVRAMSAVIAISIFGNLWVMIFTAARVGQEIAKEGIHPLSLKIATSYKTPWGRFEQWRSRRDAWSSSDQSSGIFILG